nr:hypothetical protein [Clostridium botulinum]
MTKKKKLKRKDKKEIIELITATVNLIISIATLILLILKGFKSPPFLKTSSI